MIVYVWSVKDMVGEDALATRSLSSLGIGPEHYDAVRVVCEALQKQGLTIKLSE